MIRLLIIVVVAQVVLGCAAMSGSKCASECSRQYSLSDKVAQCQQACR